MSTKEALTLKQHERPLPEGWRWVRLGEVCEFEYGASLVEAKRNKGSVPVYGSNGIVGYHSEAITSGPTIVIGRKGSVGEVHFSPVACYPIDTTYFVEYAKLPVDLEWLSSMLKVLGLANLNKASGVPGLNRNDVERLAIPLPPLPEQKRIAAILREQMAAVEKARKAAEERLETLKALPAAFLRQVFPQPGQPLPEGWRWVRLGEVCEVSWGNTSITKLSYLPSGYTAFSAAGPDGYLADYEHEKEAIILSAIGARCGKCFLAKGRWTAIKNTIVIYPKSSTTADVDFLYFYMNRETLWPVDSMAQPFITMEGVKSVRIPIPPLPEQQCIAAILREQMAAVEKARKAAEEELATINALPAALLRRAFSGEL